MTKTITMKQATIKDVFIIPKGKCEAKDYIKIGVAFLNKDGSLNVVLDALPVNGLMHIKDRVQNEL